MKKARQGPSPSSDSLRTVEVCARELRPDGPDITEWHDAYVSSHRHRIAHDLDIVRDNVPAGSSLLEVGSIPLLLTSALVKYEYAVTGCDISPERYSTAIRSLGLNVAKCDIEREALPFPDDAFDAVVFNEIFEHLRINLIFTLSEVLRVMAPGGILMLSSPNLRSLSGIRNFLFRNRAYSCSGDIYGEYRKLNDIGHMGHVREYTTTEVTEFLERIGFSVTRFIYRGRYENRVSTAVIRAVPSLSPFVSYIARKP